MKTKTPKKRNPLTDGFALVADFYANSKTFQHRPPKEERLLICGDREWTSRMSIYNKLKNLRDQLEQKRINLVVISGRCRGADKIAEDCCDELGIDQIIFPANWVGRKKAAGPIRNQRQMTDGRPTRCWAFHRDLSKSRGTADMVKRAKHTGIPVEVFKI